MGGVSKQPVFSQDAELAQRYANGETLAALVAAYGIWTAQAQRALRCFRVPLRSADTAPKLCRICNEPVRSCTKRFLCALHVGSFCSICEVRLPAGRISRWCRACGNARTQRLYARPGRVCSMCRRKPVTARTTWCPDCRRQVYLLERRMLQLRSRCCVVCGQELPQGRRISRCTACYRQHRRRLSSLRGQRGLRHCLMCGESLAWGKWSYCPECQSMIGKWRRAWHQGDEIARLLGTVEPRRRWQEPSDGPR
jgi:hypothetical protein